MATPRPTARGRTAAALHRLAVALRRLAVALRAVRRAREALAARTTSDALRSLEVPPVAERLPAHPSAWGQAVARAAWVLRADCMPRSVALARILDAGDHDVALVLGARRDGRGAWVAHAWVEVDGAAVGEAVGESVGQFTRLAQATPANDWRVAGARSETG